MLRDMLTLTGLCALTSAQAVGQVTTLDPRVVYAPDVVGVDRLFMVALKVPVEAPEVAVSVPDGVVLLDRTRLPARDEVRRFYFRASRPASAVEILFRLPDAQVTVPVTVWSFDDLREFRTLKGVQLPRRWPLGEVLAELKEGQTVTTEQEKAALRGTVAPTIWLERSDEDIWAMQPDSTIPRWHWVNIQHGCPVHGTEIYKDRAYYPWGKDMSWPWTWKIVCPVGNEAYPSNDFGHDDFTSGAFPDDGIGGGYVQDGKHYGFIAELAQAYCHQMLQVAPSCANGYLATGDVRYVHKALVALCRLAVEYAYLATMTQHRHRNTQAQVERFGQGRFDEGPCLYASGLTVYSIDQPWYLWNHAEAYDRIFPAIEQDALIIPFLQSKGFAVHTHEDVRRFIEENLFAVWMQAGMDGALHSNEPFEQRAVARAAEVLNYRRGADFMDWLYDGAGRMRVFVPNTFFRDGAPYESTGGYNGMHVTALGPIIDSVEHLRQLRPDIYPESKYPPLSKSRRYRNVFDFDMDTVTIDRSFPAIGDTGSWPAYSKLTAKIRWQAGDAAAYEHIYRLTRDPKFAWALVHSPGWKPSLNFPFTKEELQQEAARWPDDWNDASSLHDGYGIAILRSGKGDDKRALWMMYGHARGHTQDDIMDIGLQGHQGILMSHMGYPRNWGYWEHSWTSHYVARQFPLQTHTAQAELFADAGPVQIFEARAQGMVDRVDQGQGYQLLPDYWQRRLLALVDVSPEQFYCVDWYRISGGDTHWWAFHGQEGDFTTQGLNLVPQQGGTLAGPDVPYGDRNWLKAQGCWENIYGFHGPMFGLAHLYNVQRAPAEGVWSADWALKRGDGLHLRLTVLGAEGTQVAICDGTSPAGGNPYEIKWIMLNKKGEAPVRTQVLSLIEPYMNQPLIHEARPLQVSGGDEADMAPSGCVVRLADRTDTILAAADPGVLHEAEDGLRFAGRFALLSETDGQPVTMVLVGGTELSRHGVGIRVASPQYRGRITWVDRSTETIVISPAPPNPGAMVGARVFLTNPARRIAYKVLEAQATPEGARLRLDLDSRVGIGRVTGTDAFRVRTDTPFPLHRFRYYHGARIVNAAGTAEYRIIEVRDGQAAFIDPQAHPEATQEKLATEFPEGTWFEVYDYGVGDEVVWPYTVSVTRLRPGVYEVRSPVEVELRLPHGMGTDH